MPDFVVQTLNADELSDVWPVVRSGPYANIDWWLWEGTALIKKGGGVLVVRAPNGRVHGVAAFRAPPRLARRRVLRIPLFISFELRRSAPARSALLKSLEYIATRLECSHIVLPLSSRS